MDLTNEEIEVLLDLAKNITAIPSINQELFCQQAKEQSNNIPPRIKDILTNFKTSGSETGYLLIKTIPIPDTIPDTISDTPEGNKFIIGETTTLAKIQAILLNAISDQIAYEGEGSGNLFQDIIPLKTMEKEQTSLGSNTELEIHTEQAFSKLRPDILSLACLRGDLNAYTHIFPIQSILKNITKQEYELLQKPLWYTEVDLSFKLSTNTEFIDGNLRGPIPIISNQTLVFDQDLMSSPYPDAKVMIKKIINLYYQHKLRHNLKPGEIILIDNNRALHGRSAFFPRYDGKDRFLIRCFSTFDLKKSEYARPQSQSQPQSQNTNTRTRTRTVLAIYS
jgi:L-asparagine oxygenase